jgi:hypothetical protein
MIEIGPTSERLMTLDEAILYLFMFVHNGKKGWRMPTEYEYFWGKAVTIEDSWYDGKVNVANWYLTPVRDVIFVYIPKTRCYNRQILFKLKQHDDRTST